METDWPDLSDNDLAAKAVSRQESAQGAFVEAMRRLRVSNDALRRSNELYGTWLIFLTVVLALLTLVLAFKM